MASFIQLRGDTIDRFLEFDPVLGLREPALVSVDAENATLYTHMKVGDGVHKFSELPLLDLGGNIVSYNDLNDLPSIGGIQIKGDLSLEQLGDSLEASVAANSSWTLHWSPLAVQNGIVSRWEAYVNVAVYV